MIWAIQILKELLYEFKRLAHAGIGNINGDGK